jgi:hypothetical protein
MSEGIQPSITLSTIRRSDRRVVIFTGGADLVAVPAAKLRRKRDRKQPRRGARRKAARPSRGFVRREPRRRDRLRAPVRHGAVTPKRSGQFDAVEKPLSSLAALRRSVGDDMKRRRCRVPSVSLFELSPPSPSPARLLGASPLTHRRDTVPHTCAGDGTSRGRAQDALSGMEFPRWSVWLSNLSLLE